MCQVLCTLSPLSYVIFRETHKEVLLLFAIGEKVRLREVN